MIFFQPDLTHIGINDYSSEMYADEAASIIGKHNATNTGEPLFLYFPLQSVHNPLQSTSDCEDDITDITDPTRKTMAGMIKCMDNAIGVVMHYLLFFHWTLKVMIFIIISFD